MQPEIKRVYDELQMWCDKQTSPAIRMRGTIILSNLVDLASDPHDMDLLRMTRQNVAGLEEAAALMRRRSRPVTEARTSPTPL
jgi:hypothetical protein